MLRDMMPHFELYQPVTLENALSLLQELDEKSWILAGGYDSLDWFKDRAKRPSAVVDISGIESLKGISETAEGLEIGALTTLTEVERHPIVARSTRCSRAPRAMSRVRRSAMAERSAET